MNPELESQLRAALSKAIAVPATLSPYTRESVIDYLVTGAVNKAWTRLVCYSFNGDICSLVDCVLYYLCFGLHGSLEAALLRLNATLDHYCNEP